MDAEPYKSSSQCILEYRNVPTSALVNSNYADCSRVITLHKTIFLSLNTANGRKLHLSNILFMARWFGLHSDHGLTPALTSLPQQINRPAK